MDASLSGLSASDFVYDNGKAVLALAFISPHINFSDTVRELERLAGDTPVIAVSTAGELCRQSGGSLYRPTGDNWSTITVQIFPPDLIQDVSVHTVPLHNEDIRAGEPKLNRKQRVENIATSLSSVSPPFTINSRDVFALTFIDGFFK